MGRGVQAQARHLRMVHGRDFRRLEIRFRANFRVPPAAANLETRPRPPVQPMNRLWKCGAQIVERM
jgi:hypothetical protein